MSFGDAQIKDRGLSWNLILFIGTTSALVCEFQRTPTGGHAQLAIYSANFFCLVRL
jgi:hypothetical protein